MFLDKQKNQPEQKYKNTKNTRISKPTSSKTQKLQKHKKQPVQKYKNTKITKIQNYKNTK